MTLNFKIDIFNLLTKLTQKNDYSETVVVANKRIVLVQLNL